MACKKNTKKWYKDQSKALISGWRDFKKLFQWIGWEMGEMDGLYQRIRGHCLDMGCIGQLKTLDIINHNNTN